MYLVGTKFSVETDHKQLVVILNTKHLEELSVRIQLKNDEIPILKNNKY